MHCHKIAMFYKISETLYSLLYFLWFKILCLSVFSFCTLGMGCDWKSSYALKSWRLHPIPQMKLCEQSRTLRGSMTLNPKSLIKEGQLVKNCNTSLNLVFLVVLFFGFRKFEMDIYLFMTPLLLDENSIGYEIEKYTCVKPI